MGRAELLKPNPQYEDRFNRFARSHSYSPLCVDAGDTDSGGTSESPSDPG